jgi:hypothetical protein
MPFIEVNPILAHRTDRSGAVRFACRKVKAGLSAMVYVPLKVASQLDWSEKTRLKLSVGTGQEAGTLRLSPSAIGSIVIRKLGGKSECYQIALGEFVGLAVVPSKIVQHSIDGHLEIVVPGLRSSAPPTPPAQHAAYKSVR